MTITLIDSANRTGSSTKNDALDHKLDGESKGNPAEFGQLMSDILATRKTSDKTAAQQLAVSEAAEQAAGGQEIATPTLGTGMASSMPIALNLTGQDFLKTVILGPHLNVITPETSAPDEQSLEAFARSQGLDETAVQWLMGTPGQASTLTQTLTAEGLKPLAIGAVINASTPTESSAQAILTAQQTLAAGHAVPLTPNPVLTPAQTAALTAASDPAATPIANRAETTTSGGLLTSAALWAMAQPTEKALVQADKQAQATEDNAIQIHFMRSPPPAALWMQGNTLVNSPAKETPGHKNSVATSDLDLSGLVSEELLRKLAQISPDAQTLDGAAAEDSVNAAPGAPSSPLSGHTGHRMDLATAVRQEAQNSQATATEPGTSTAQRSETIQNLSEKMGQAVGQRILSEIEKGQWHLKLMLRPATLGHIEVEIRMRSGELDAFFTAPQALTRDLLQDGMSKLKETLGQMGMNVASAQVSDGQTQQRGGDSTPSQNSKVINSDLKESKSTETQQINIQRTKMGQDGWDVLV